MTTKKKDRVTATCNAKVYEVAGRWDSRIVLPPVEGQDDQCLTCTPGESEALS